MLARHLSVLGYQTTFRLQVRDYHPLKLYPRRISCNRQVRSNPSLTMRFRVVHSAGRPDCRFELKWNIQRKGSWTSSNLSCEVVQKLSKTAVDGMSEGESCFSVTCNLEDTNHFSILLIWIAFKSKRGYVSADDTGRQWFHFLDKTVLVYIPFIDISISSKQDSYKWINNSGMNLPNQVSKPLELHPGFLRSSWIWIPISNTSDLVPKPASATSSRQIGQFLQASRQYHLLRSTKGVQGMQLQQKFYRAQYTRSIGLILMKPDGQGSFGIIFEQWLSFHWLIEHKVWGRWDVWMRGMK